MSSLQSGQKSPDLKRYLENPLQIRWSEKLKSQSINHSWAQSSSVSGNRRVQLRPKKGPRLSQDGGDEPVQADEITSRHQKHTETRA